MIFKWFPKNFQGNLWTLLEQPIKGAIFKLITKHQSTGEWRYTEFQKPAKFNHVIILIYDKRRSR